MDDGIRVEINPADLAATLKAVKAFSPALATATRKRLRVAGADIVTAMQDAALQSPGGGSARGRLHGKKSGNGSMRQNIAAGIKVAIVAGSTRQGISIQATSSRLTSGQAAMVKAWNKKTFRHPVFKDPSTFVTQSGRPYFGAVAMERKALAAQAMQDALSDAIKEIE